MHFFSRPLRALFLGRLNRFLIRCEYRGRSIDTFLPNPGRLQELLLPESIVYVVPEAGGAHRKTHYTAVAVEKDGHPIMLHTHRTNDAARYLLQHRKIPGLARAGILRSEIQIGRSRFDFLLSEGGRNVLLEVKSCTLVGDQVAMFPDAVTARGTRHLEELALLSEEGMKTAVLFIVHWPFARFFMPDYHTDLKFSRTLLRGARQGSGDPCVCWLGARPIVASRGKATSDPLGIH